MNDKFRNLPIYESLSGDYKFPAVLDIGSAYTKIGVSGECSPRAIIRSEIQCRKTNTQRQINDYTDAADLYDMFVELIHTIYFKYLLINPKDKHVVVVESPLTPIIWRETLVCVLYKHYEVASLLLVPTHSFALASLAIDTGLVVDVGYTEVTVLPVCSNYLVLHAWQALPIGTQAVQNNIKNMLAQDNIGSDITQLPDGTFEDIYVRTCFVTTKSRSEQLQLQQHKAQPVAGVIYPLSARQSLVVSGRVRELAHEVQHVEDGDHQCLATMVLDAVMCATVDMRLQLLRNIVVIGGGAMALGFKARLKDELKCQVAASHHRYRALNKAQFEFHTIPGRENYAAWLGGAICGCTEMASMKALTREQYFKLNRLPDWIDLRDNSLQN